MPDADAFLRELHHRVKNNFQIIASLMSLQKRMLPLDRRDDLRFIEEHVQAMAVAYRVVYATHELIEVSIRELVREVLESLQQIAGPTRNVVALHLIGADQTIGLNQAIALSLYLAVVVPPHLDFAASVGRTFDLNLRLESQRVDLVLRGNWEAPVIFDSLRNRLAKAYERQLNAEILPTEHPVEIGLRFPLISPREA
jgi:histidine kinase